MTAQQQPAAAFGRRVGLLAMLSALLVRRERNMAFAIIGLMFCMACLEAVGIASIMPFMAVLSAPEVVSSNAYLKAVYDALGYQSPREFLMFLGLVILLLFIGMLALKGTTIYAIARFSSMRTHSISCRLLEAYLRQPYDFFLGRNTSDLGKTVLTEVATVTNGVLMPGMRILSGSIVAITILCLLLVVEPVLSLSAAMVLGSAYVAIYLIVRGVLRRIGVARLQANQERFRYAGEALSGIKELRILNREESYLSRYRRPSHVMARHLATNQAISTLPNLLVQALAFGGILVVVLVLLERMGTLSEALPLISLFAFAGYRLMPAFNDIFANISQIRFGLPALEVLYNDLQQKERLAEPMSGSGASLSLEREIRFEDVSYDYGGSNRPALRNIDLTIRAGESVAFVGSTGAGKSTAIDLILGLLQPTDGRITVDGRPLAQDNLRAWQRHLGYVPQAIFLSDDTVAANIAFGVEPDRIDRAAVERAARAARIHDFIVEDLPDGYDTVVGERGIRMSGGQRQRLAIARALYRDTEIVVFDEATSALDTATEAAVMSAIEALHGRKTVILIAHRLSTVRHCDRLFMLEDGALVAQGSFDEISHNSPSFARMLAAGGGAAASGR